MSEQMGGALPAPNRQGTVSKVRRSYCRRDGWTCRPGQRCDEHKPSRDPARLRDLLGGAR